MSRPARMTQSANKVPRVMLRANVSKCHIALLTKCIHKLDCSKRAAAEFAIEALAKQLGVEVDSAGGIDLSGMKFPIPAVDGTDRSW